MIVLYLGGARSGKSELAERRATEIGGDDVTYVATAVVTDRDFAARVAEHQLRRPPVWRTVETGPPGTGPQLADVVATTAGTLLVDSLGTWVAGHGSSPPDVAALVAALTDRDGDAVVVAEEVGLGVHPTSEVGRRFRDVLGRVNQAVASAADEAWLVVAGRVVRLDRP